MSEHLPGYQARDFEVVDYQLYQLDGTGLWFRGPRPERLSAGEYFVCIGAAQTFGCLCERPFPALLQEMIELPALNLGYGGAGPFFFLKHPALLDHINKARFAIVQVMSGRSESNRLFDSGGLEYLTRRQDGSKLSADQAYEDLLRPASRPLPGPSFMNKLVRAFIAPPGVRRLVAETRENWISNQRQLLEAISVPKILFWFAKRGPWYWQRYNRAHALFGGFPQLVNRRMIESVMPFADHYVECVSERGAPHYLTSRFTGERVVIDLSRDRGDFTGTWEINNYYPTPEMHEDAARALESRCRTLVSHHGAPG